MADQIAECPVCKAKLPTPLDAQDFVRLPITCLNCGIHRYDGSAMTDLLANRYNDRVTKARLAYGLRRVDEHTPITDVLLRNLERATTLPTAHEQIDNLVIHIATTKRPGEVVSFAAAHLRAILGVVKTAEAQWVLQQALTMELVSHSGTHGLGIELREGAMTAKGWARYAELMRTGARSTHAFMAMKFGDPQLTDFYRDHLRPAIAQTGFDLRATFEDHKTAGSIDNRMRVEIRTSRFLVCDLTHGNRGAYWEAGFAEGLGRPVFYVCRADVLWDKNHPDHPHFDTAHQLIIAWDPADPGPGLQELKDVVRATLPAEARMADA